MKYTLGHPIPMEQTHIATSRRDEKTQYLPTDTLKVRKVNGAHFPFILKGSKRNLYEDSFRKKVFV